MKRRDALSHLAYAAALLGTAAPSTGSSFKVPALPDKKLLETTPEAYWLRIRNDQFLLPKWRAFLNNGSLGVVSKPVFADIADYLQRSAELNVDHYPRWGYETLDEEREEMAAFLGCHKDELAFTHNCTEAMNIVANGLDLKEGDEVLLTDQEHTGGTACWEMKAARFGTKFRKVPIPIAPPDPAEITERLISAIRPRTRVLSFSGITTNTGLILPVQQICKAARAKGVITVVDGAHMNGQIPVDLHDLGCDYFAGSPHKWMFAPAGCGILYGRPEMLDRLWPSIVSGGWNNKEQLKAARFMRIGTKQSRHHSRHDGRPAVPEEPWTRERLPPHE